MCPSSTANADFLNWLNVTMAQNACNCHQVITDWCTKELNDSGADQITWGINDVSNKDFCGPEILNINQGLHPLIGRCFKSACEIQVYPCTDQIPDCTLVAGWVATDQPRVREMCGDDGLAPMCPDTCQDVELPSCGLVTQFRGSSPDLATRMCNLQGLHRFCPVACGVPFCTSATD